MKNLVLRAWKHHETPQLKHYGENFVRRKFLTAKIPYGEISVRREILTAKIPYGENSVRRNIHTAKNPTAKIPTAKIPTVKIPATGFAIESRTPNNKVVGVQYFLS